MGDDTPYADAGWTLPFQMNVSVVEGRTPLTSETRAALRPVSGTPVDWRSRPDAPFTTNPQSAGIMPVPGGITGRGSIIAVDPAQNNSFRLMNRALAAGGTVRFQPATGASGGRYLVSGVGERAAGAWADSLWVRARRVRPTGVSHPAPTRIALYKAAPGNMDQGWTEWLLDTHDFRY